MELNSAIRGHHVYKEIWNPFIGEELQCKMEHGNVHDMYAVAVTREDIVVGHLPRNISTPCHLFLRRGGNIACVVNGARRFSADLIQGGLEVPCRLTFQGSSRDVDKIRKMLQDAPKEQPKQPEVKQEVQESKRTTVKEQPEPEQRSVMEQPGCMLKQPNLQNTDNSSNKEQQRQMLSVIEQPQQWDIKLEKPREQQNRHPGIHEQQNTKQHSVAEPTKQHSSGCEDVIVVDNFADIDDNDIWLKTCKITLFIADRKQLIAVGSPLNDKHINLAQTLLKHQFPKQHGFYSTLLQHKTLKKITTGIQIIHINYHWLTAAKFSPDESLKVYDSVNFSLTDEMKSILTNIFEFSSIEMVTMQKQKESNICGLYAIAVATAIAHHENPTELLFKEDQMRNHLCTCFEEGLLSTFPTL